MKWGNIKIGKDFGNNSTQVKCVWLFLEKIPLKRFGQFKDFLSNFRKKGKFFCYTSGGLFFVSPEVTLEMLKH